MKKKNRNIDVKQINELNRWLGRLEKDITRLKNNDHIDNIDELVGGYIRIVFRGSDKSIENYNQKLEKIRHSTLGMVITYLDGREKSSYVSHAKEYTELMDSLRKALKKEITRLSKQV